MSIAVVLKNTKEIILALACSDGAVRCVFLCEKINNMARMISFLIRVFDGFDRSS